MSKIEEALEKANKLRGEKKINTDRQGHAPEGKKIKKVNNHCLVTINQPDSPVAEEYRRLKSMLLRETKEDFLNTIMVTSSVESEGKTMTAINLAVTLAQEIDHTVLLIDADLRKSMIHTNLEISNEKGLTDYLTKDMDISEILVKTGIGKLTVVPAGKPVDNPVELLASDKMKGLIKELKQRYMDRYIIIDTPPILSCAEGIAIGSYVDGVLFVVKEGNAKEKTVKTALNVLKDLNILGVVFNSVSNINLEGYYSSYYFEDKKKEV